jgi:hypothetical protein
VLARKDCGFDKSAVRASIGLGRSDAAGAVAGDFDARFLLPRLRCRALIDVFEPLDIVFAEIATGLDLNQLERDFPFVGHAVHASDRDVDRLVLVHGTDLITDCHLGRATHDNPVLGAMAMFLQ